MPLTEATIDQLQSTLAELRELDESIQIASIMLNESNRQGTVEWRDGIINKQRRIIAKAQSEIDRANDLFMRSEDNVRKYEAQIRRLEKKRKLSANAGKIRKLIKAAREYASLIKDVEPERYSDLMDLIGAGDEA